MLRATAEGVTLAVRARPGAKRTSINGVYGEAMAAELKVSIQAAPIEGRANQALIAFFAELFGLPRSAVELVSGGMSQSKVLLLRGMTMARATAVLAQKIDV